MKFGPGDIQLGVLAVVSLLGVMVTAVSLLGVAVLNTGGGDKQNKGK